MQLSIKGKAILLYFVRWPQPGLVKSRLAKSIGEAEACGVYRLLAKRCFAQARSVPEASLVVCHTGGSFDGFTSWLPGADAYWEQAECGLGGRMEKVFDKAFAEGARVVGAIGSDAPGLDSRSISEALARLDESDVSILPARDGGYVFLGCARNAPELFRGIPWGTDCVLSATTSICGSLGLSVALGPVFDDVDTLDDWNASKRLFHAADFPQGADSR